MVGIFSGSLIGYGASHAPFRLLHVTLAVIAAAVLNAASNGLNQVCDLENDRINKPHRPLPSGSMTMRDTRLIAALSAIFASAFRNSSNIG